MAEWLGEGGRKMEECQMKAPDLVHVRTVPYDLDCNWKVFNDNYLVSPITPVTPITPCPSLPVCRAILGDILPLISLTAIQDFGLREHADSIPALLVNVIRQIL